MEALLEARVYFDQHPLYLVGPLGELEIGQMVTLPPGGRWYSSRKRTGTQEAKVIARHHYKRWRDDGRDPMRDVLGVPLRTL